VKLAAVAVALLAALAVVLGFVIARGGEEDDFRGSEPPPDLTMPPFDVGGIDSEGLRGKAVAVTFLDTQCTDACPVAAAQIGRAVDLLAGDRAKVAVLAFSVDPAGDTPASIERFLRRFRALGRIRYVDGTVAEFRPLWRAFGVLPSVDTGSSNMHSVPVRVYDRDGRWRSTLHPGVDLTPANLAHDLEAALKT
jgi:cytochrome oxidase Cu insertion factor (SCO1/SenC/PrrC family)